MKIITIPCRRDNFSYLLICEETGQAAVIDPSEPEAVLKTIQNQNIELQWILCTHHHGDHTEGIKEISTNYPSAKIGGPAKEQKMIPEINHPFKDHDSIQVGEVKGKIIETPGHTKGSLCYLFANAVFTGDTLFGGGCGRLFEGTAKEMFISLNQKLAYYMTEETQIYFAHEYTLSNLKFAQTAEPENRDIQDRLLKEYKKIDSGNHSTPSTWIEEMKTNPFLRVKSPEELASIREWKNRF